MQLLQTAKHKGPSALGSLLELYRNYLRILARSQLTAELLPRATPSDVVQDTFLEAYRDFVQFRGNTPGGVRRMVTADSDPQHCPAGRTSHGRAKA